ncbi:MAG: hypothetical protein LBG24_09915 [Treponema sp.]|nr:hypothetical protein [Treponema sp.]
MGDILNNGTIISGALRDDRRSFAGNERIILENYRLDRDFFSGAGRSGG